MSEPHTPHDGLPDPLRRSGAATDQPLSLEARTPGPSGGVGKFGLAVLGLLVLFAMVAAMWIAAHQSRKGEIETPPSKIAAQP